MARRGTPTPVNCPPASNVRPPGHARDPRDARPVTAFGANQCKPPKAGRADPASGGRCEAHPICRRRSWSPRRDAAGEFARCVTLSPPFVPAPSAQPPTVHQTHLSSPLPSLLTPTSSTPAPLLLALIAINGERTPLVAVSFVRLRSSNPLPVPLIPAQNRTPTHTTYTLCIHTVPRQAPAAWSLKPSQGCLRPEPQ